MFMKDKWLKRLEFYALCIAPMFVMLWISRNVGPAWFTISFFMYTFYYRPFVHIYRLGQMGAIEEKEAWKLFIPFYHTRYMKQLWLG